MSSFFAMIPDYMISDERISPPSIKVFAVIWIKALGKEGCAPTQNWIARESNLSRWTVNGCIKELRQAGYIEIVNVNRGGPITYRPCIKGTGVGVIKDDREGVCEKPTTSDEEKQQVKKLSTQNVDNYVDNFKNEEGGCVKFTQGVCEKPTGLCEFHTPLASPYNVLDKIETTEPPISPKNTSSESLSMPTPSSGEGPSHPHRSSEEGKTPPLRRPAGSSISKNPPAIDRRFQPIQVKTPAKQGHRSKPQTSVAYEFAGGRRVNTKLDKEKTGSNKINKVSMEDYWRGVSEENKKIMAGLPCNQEMGNV